MAKRVRFLSLTLAGFGRYDRPTRFELAGRCCSFTSPNEQGKSTFLAGLLATLFSPPTVRSKLIEFQTRHRSWNNPSSFCGELEFAVGDEQWRVRQEFDAQEVKVWRILSDGTPESRLESKTKTSRKTAEGEAYARLLQEWLGLSDRSLYEAMFTISQQTTLAASWQIDPRVASMVYGQAVERLDGNLQELYGRFREITRNTREHHIAIGSQGERNGRSDGRLEQITARIVEIESSIAAAHQRAETIQQLRSRVTELDGRGEELRREIAGTSHSLSNWRAWIELESRLRPAVESYERLRQLNERCQQATRPLAELRGRLAGKLAIFDNAPSDLAERLEWYPLLGEAVEEARRRYTEQTSRCEQLRREIDEFNAILAGEFANHRNRPGLADQVEQLQLVSEEIVGQRARLEELTKQLADAGEPGGQVFQMSETPVDAVDETQDQPTADNEVVTHQQQIDRLASWTQVGLDWADRLGEARNRVEQFARDRAGYVSNTALALEATRRLEQLDRHIAQLEAEQRDLASRRDAEQRRLIALAQEARGTIEQASAAKARLEAARRDVERRFVDFQGAPPQLLELWDQLHTVEATQLDARRNFEAAGEALRELERRTLWRRGLTGIGCVVLGTFLLWSQTWLDRAGAAAVLSLIACVRRIYREEPAKADAAKELRERDEADYAQLGRQRDELITQVGPQFVVPPERQAEWRRLWPTYRRELERLDAEASSIPGEDDLAKLRTVAADADAQQARFDRDTEVMLAEADGDLRRAKTEHQEHAANLDRLREQLNAHWRSYFGTDRGGLAREAMDIQALPEGGDVCPSEAIPADLFSESVESLPPCWGPVVRVARADRPAMSTIGEVVEWCGSVDEGRWTHFADCCRELEKLTAQMQLLSSEVQNSSGPDACLTAAPTETAEKVSMEATGRVGFAHQLRPMVVGGAHPTLFQQSPTACAPGDDPSHTPSPARTPLALRLNADLDRLADEHDRAKERLVELEQQAARLQESIAPFSAETDASWLRERWQACQSIETQIAERGRELEQIHTLPSIEAEIEEAGARHAEATEVLAPFLEGFDRDPQRVLAALGERAELAGRLHPLEAQATEVLADSGFATLEELAHDAGKAEGLVATVRASAQQLLEQANELWEAVDAPPELATQRASERESRLAELQGGLDALERERAELAATMRQMEADPANDLNALQVEVESLRAEQTDLQAKRDQIAAQFQETSRLMQELQRVERTALEGRITAFFADFSRTTGRCVQLDEELHITIRNEDGTRYAPDQLSHGARDQLYLAVYLATSVGFDLPFVLDDPFVNCDTERLAAIRACWDRLVPDRQLILLSHDPQLAAWAPPLEISQAA